MKLSTLEKKEFDALMKDIRLIKKAYTTGSDSIHDFTCSQFAMTTDEPKVLAQAQDSLQIIVDKLSSVIDRTELLHEHFTKD